jgi:hypothetical protein
MNFLLFVGICISFLYIIIACGSNKMVSYNDIPVHIRKVLKICIMCTQIEDLNIRQELIYSAIYRIETLIDVYGVDTIKDRCGINLHDILDSMYHLKNSL